MMTEEDEFGFVAFDDLAEDEDEFGFVPFEPSKKQQTQHMEESPQIIEEFETGKRSLSELNRHEEPEIKEEFPFEGENDLEREIERNIAQQTSRIGETLAGAPGDIYSFVKSLFGGESETNLPTSKSLREQSENLSQGYTKPQSEFEERIGEVQQDIASFMIPGSNKYNLFRNIGIPLLSNLAEEGVKYSGNDKIAGAVKSGLMVGLDLMHLKGGGAKKFAGNLFDESEKLVKEGEKLTSKSFIDSILHTKKILERGGTSPSTEKALTKINEILSKTQNGEIEIKELIAFRKKINEIKKTLGGYDPAVPTDIRKKAISNLDIVKKEVIGALDEYGAKINPEFGKINKAANEAYGAFESSNKIAEYIKQTVKNSIKHPGLKTLLGLGGGGYGVYAHGATIAKGAATGTLPLLGAYEGYKVLHQVIQSPTLRKFYGNILKGAASGNASQVSKNAKALEKAFEEEED